MVINNNANAENKKLVVAITKFNGGIFSLKTLVVLGFVWISSLEYDLSNWIKIPILIVLWLLLDLTINREVNNWFINTECEVRIKDEK